MVIRMILAMSFSILQHCCARSLPSVLRHFQPESAEDSCPPARKIWSRPAEDPRHTAQLSAGVCAEQPRNSSKKLSFPCLVPYIGETN